MSRRRRLPWCLRWTRCCRASSEAWWRAIFKFKSDQGLHAQTQEVLQIIDALLARVGSDKSRILSCQIFLKDIEQIIGSGSLTHNLYEFRTGEAQAAAYAQEFSAWVRQAVRDGDMAGAMLAEGMQMTELPRHRTGSVVLAPPGAAHRNRAEHHNQHQGTV